MAGGAPGGLTEESFESDCLEVGDWIWGTAQGAFNEKATLSQIIVDAAIGMIPFVGDVTGLRDLIAIIIGLSTDSRKREEKSQWILLAVFGFALIPVIGGVIKGVGRLLLEGASKLARTAGQAERAAQLAESGRKVAAFLNHAGFGNAERWLSELHVIEHQQALLQKLDALAGSLGTAASGALKHVGGWLPDSLIAGTQHLVEGLEHFRQIAPAYLPSALKQLDTDLRQLQAYVRSGGETTSYMLAHAVDAGVSDVHRVEELMLIEGRGATRSARGGWEANSAVPEQAKNSYVHEPGFPDLAERPKGSPKAGKVSYPTVATYSGEIVNRELQPGERVFRVFGPAGETHGVPVAVSKAGGSRSLSFWGLNEVPTAAEVWRQGSAVLDEWNRDGFIVIGTVLEGQAVPACTGRIAEQVGKDLVEQYLGGGAKQAILEVPATLQEWLNEIGERVSTSQISETLELGGLRWEVRPTGWTDVNGIYGYRNMPGPGSVQTVRLESEVIASKIQNE